MAIIVNNITVHYTGENKTADVAWDYIQKTVSTHSLCVCTEQDVLGVRQRLPHGDVMAF